MSTPALARATAALRDKANESRRFSYLSASNWGRVTDDLRGYADIDARAAVSAALHDPDDPDWLARVHDGHRRVSPAHMDTSLCSCGERFPTQWRWCQHVARAVRAAILGETA